MCTYMLKIPFRQVIQDTPTIKLKVGVHMLLYKRAEKAIQCEYILFNIFFYIFMKWTSSTEHISFLFQIIIMHRSVLAGHDGFNNALLHISPFICWTECCSVNLLFSAKCEVKCCENIGFNGILMIKQ